MTRFDDAGVFKVYDDADVLGRVLKNATARTNAGKMSVELVISTEDEDRSGDIVVTKGIALADHKRNPVALFNHDKDAPIGRYADRLDNYTVKVRGGRELVGELFFNQSSAFAHDVFRRVEDKTFSAGSIGFLPVEVEARQPRGRHFKRSNMVEASILSLGDNPNAVVEAVHKHYGGKPPSEEFVRILTPYLPERTVSVVGGYEAKAGQPPYPPRRQGGQPAGATPPADPMAPVDDPVTDPSQMDPNGPPADPHPDSDAAHKDVVDSAIADMMGSIYNQYCDGVIDKVKALAMFAHLLDSHGTVSGMSDDDLGEEPDVSDLGDEDGDGIPDAEDADADGDGVPDAEEDGDDEKAKKKCYAAFEKHYQPKMTVVWEFLRRVEGHPKLSVPKVQAKAGEMAGLMETLPPIEKALADGQLVLKAAAPPAPAEDYTEELAVAKALSQTLYAITGNAALIH